ncbi:MAG: hypothetical protein WBO97_03490, partial [Tepidiformaceae bacterium]
SVAAGADSNGVTIFGTKATIRWKMGDAAVIQLHGGEARTIEPDPGTARGWKVEDDFVASIRDGAPVRLTSFADGVRYMQVIDAAHDSYTSGRVVPIKS